VDFSADRSVLITGKRVNHALNIAKSSDSAVLDIGNADKDSTLVAAGQLSSQRNQKT
jgi:DNA-binding transcriptional regulator LsrR (DeoR family)